MTPTPWPRPGLPSRVSIYEVGPRDGLQNEAAIIPVATKLKFIERLVTSGLRTVEATSFVAPKWVPQLADADALFPQLPAVDGVSYPVLVPNIAGLDRALAAGARHVAIFASATEIFSHRNLNRSRQEARAAFAPVVDRARAEGAAVRGYLSMCFGDPWSDPVPVEEVAAEARLLMDLGCSQLSFGDTIGVATPGHVTALLDALTAVGIDGDSVAVHFHDTYGQALANTLTALEQGVTTVDASAGGLGGCPYAGSATGNLATEDLCWMLHGLGIDTGVDLAALVATSVWMAAQLGRPSPSAVVRALAPTASEEAR